jgi:uncharacterized membrane protein
MTTQERQTNNVPYPSIPPIIDSRQTEYRGSGITSSVSILGHPIHPIIVIFPVAFLSGVAGTDIAYWLTKDIFWARASVWLLGLGLFTGILAAIIGMIDFFRIPRVQQRTAGWAHMLLNISVLVLSAVNWFVRLWQPVSIIIPLGIILSFVVALLLLVSGWYGGELTFRHKIGVIGSNETHTL